MKPFNQSLAEPTISLKHFLKISSETLISNHLFLALDKTVIRIPYDNGYIPFEL